MIATVCTLRSVSFKWLIFYFFLNVFNKDAVSLARMEEEPEAAARKLTEVAFSRGSADNITCIVVRFHHDKSDADSSLNAGDKN